MKCSGCATSFAPCDLRPFAQDDGLCLDCLAGELDRTRLELAAANTALGVLTGAVGVAPGNALMAVNNDKNERNKV